MADFEQCDSEATLFIDFFSDFNNLDYLIHHIIRSGLLSILGSDPRTVRSSGRTEKTLKFDGLAARVALSMVF